MTKINQDMAFHAGTVHEVAIPLVDNTGAAVDVTGHTATWVLSASNEFTSPVLTKTVGSGITLSGTAGFILALAAADTTDLSGKYYHRLTDTNGTNVSVVTTGQVTIY